MQAYVFPDKGLARHAGRFVWLSIDTERPENAAFLERYPIEAWPTLLIIDPSDGSVAVRWLGGMTVPQLERLLDDGERAVKGGGGADVESALARADKLYGEGKKDEAIVAYLDALHRAPEDWKNRPRVVESALLAMATSDRLPRCVELARAEVPKMSHSPSRANAAAVGLGCALQSPSSDPSRAAAIAELEPLVREELAYDLTTGKQMQADDISGLYDTLVSAREDAGDEAGKRADAQKWATYLEGEAAKAKTAEARTVFDSHRLGAYLALGEVQRAVPMLEESERALPEDYNPPARLSFVYKELGRLDDALAANDRALRLVYGPRTLRVLQTRAEILQAKGDLTGAKKALQDALAAYDALPESQRNEGARKRLEKSLNALGAPDGGPKQ